MAERRQVRVDDPSEVRSLVEDPEAWGFIEINGNRAFAVCPLCQGMVPSTDPQRRQHGDEHVHVARALNARALRPITLGPQGGES